MSLSIQEELRHRGEPLVAAAFAFFVAMMVLQLAFARRVMPETRGGTLEDVERRLAART